jgi:hypothetical protein
MTHNFTFTDGYTWAVDARKVLTMRHLYCPDGVSWSADHVAQGVMPPGPPTGGWVVTCPDGAERVVQSTASSVEPAVEPAEEPDPITVLDGTALQMASVKKSKARKVAAT